MFIIATNPFQSLGSEILKCRYFVQSVPRLYSYVVSIFSRMKTVMITIIQVNFNSNAQYGVEEGAAVVKSDECLESDFLAVKRGLPK